MPVAVASRTVFPEAGPASSFSTPESRAAEALLQRQIRGAVLHALAYYDEKGRAELVDDLCQEVWCRLLERRALARFRGEGAASRRRYLRRIAVNVVVDDLRLRGARKRQPARLLSLDAARIELGRRFEPAESPERRLLARERLRALLALCRKVVGDEARPERWRVARLGLLEGRPSVEIARRLGGTWSVIAIDSYLSRLRQRLGRHGVRIPFRARGGVPR
jgi:RNA polymerase sigma factor (sigma-70 family)